MEEILINQRFHNLEKAIKKSFNRMQTDALAHQLELHRTSSKFTNERLSEVFLESIDIARESFIQKLLQAIEQASCENDKVKLLIQKENAKSITNQKMLENENAKLKQRQFQLSEKLSELQYEDSSLETKYRSAIRIRQEQYRKSLTILSKARKDIKDLNSHIQKLRADTTLLSTSTIRDIRTLKEKSKQESGTYLYKFNEQQLQETKKNINSQKQYMRKVQQKRKELDASIHSLTKYLQEVATSSLPPNKILKNIVETNNSKEMEKEQFSNLLNQVIQNEQQKAIQTAIKKSGGSKAKTAEDYAHDLQVYYKSAIAQKDREIAELIEQAKKRRNRLQEELQKALDHIKELQDSQLSTEWNVVEQFEDSQSQYISQAKSLDDSISQLQKSFAKKE